MSCGDKPYCKQCMYLHSAQHDDVIKWKHIPRYLSVVRGIDRWHVVSPHKGQWRRALIFSLMCAWTNGWINSPDAGDLRRHRAHYVVTVMKLSILIKWCTWFVGNLNFCTGSCIQGHPSLRNNRTHCQNNGNMTIACNEEVRDPHCSGYSGLL